MPQDGSIITEELIALFGETCADGDDVRQNAVYWMKQIDGHGDNTGFITLVGIRSPFTTETTLYPISSLG